MPSERAAEIAEEQRLAVEGQKWADAVMDRYEQQHRYSPDDTMPGAPERHIVSWGARQPGQLQVDLSGTDWNEGQDLEYFARKMLVNLDDSSVRTLTIATHDGQQSFEVVAGETTA